MVCELIVMGCSWGGMAAVSEVLHSLPADVGSAVVVIQHRGPNRSMLAPLLDRRSSWSVAEPEDKEQILPGHVYVAPADYHLLVDRGHLSLSTDGPVHYSRPSIDVAFESAADAYGDQVVAVVLTGANADGAEGGARIVERGGRLVVQDPATAERAEMPLAALATGVEASVLALERIGPFLGALCGATSDQSVARA